MAHMSSVPSPSANMTAFRPSTHPPARELPPPSPDRQARDRGRINEGREHNTSREHKNRGHNARERHGKEKNRGYRQRGPDGGRAGPGSAAPAKMVKPAGGQQRQREPDGREVYGALDLGTNNCRLLLARPSRRGFQVVDAFSRIIRLGEGVSQTGALSEAAMSRTIDALRVCAQKIERHGVRRAMLIATEACRVASNGAEFLDRVEDSTGLKIEILSREGEARLAVAGCASLIDPGVDYVLVFDIGGGSSELVWLDLTKIPPESRGGVIGRAALQNAMIAWTSLPVGVVSLAEIFGGRFVSQDVFVSMVEHVMAMLRPFEEKHRIVERMAGKPQHLLGTSGTVTTVAGVYLGLPRYDRSRRRRLLAGIGCRPQRGLRSFGAHLCRTRCRAVHRPRSGGSGAGGLCDPGSADADVAEPAPACRRPRLARRYPDAAHGGGSRHSLGQAAAPAARSWQARLNPGAGLQCPAPKKAYPAKYVMAKKSKSGSSATGPDGGRRQLKVRVKTARKRSVSSARWLERQLNDPYVKAAKLDGMRSRAAYKLTEIDDKYRLLKPGMRVIDLGAAPGGWSQIAAERVRSVSGDGQVIGIDYLDVDTLPGVTLLKLDFMDETAEDQLKALLRGGAADVVLSDMAAPTVGHTRTDHLRIMALAEAAAYFAIDVLAPGGAFLCKVFQGGTERELLDKLKRHFSVVRHVKPPASRSQSAELYVLATGFKGAG